jgi:choline-sulfatase
MAQRWRRTEELRRRVAWSLGLAALSTLGLALADARWLRSAGADAPWGEAVLTLSGVVAPVALTVGAVVGFASWLVHPRVAPSIARLVAQLRSLGAGRQADVAAFVPLALLGLFAWTTLVGQLARATLGLAAPTGLAGGATTLAALLSLAFVALSVLAAVPTVRRLLAIGSGTYRWLVDPAWTLALALAVVGGAIAFGVSRGTVSGEGGILGIYGVLKRPELDLRMPGAWLAFAIAVYLGPSLVGALSSRVALVLACLPLALTVRAARSLDHHLELGRAVERSAPVTKLPLAMARRWSDRDRDGASGWFGGGDCDDRDPSVGPGAEDVPDNGRDEDCSGSDLTLAGLAPRPVATATPSARDRLPKGGNLVLVTVDTLRAELGYSGYARPVSPNLDALAARSAVFERAYALASYTGKSIGPTLIGKYGSETHRNWGHFNKFAEEDTFVAERLKALGMKTIAVHAHRYFGNFGGLDRGFDVVDLSTAPPESASWATEQSETSSRLTDAAIAQLEGLASDARFFLWVHYLDPHADYLSHADTPSFGRSPRDLYDHEVAHTDRHIGRLLDHLSQQPWADRTSILVTSDHGEAFGEHGMMRHGFELWEPLVRVPLIVHVPGLAPTRIQERRSLVDLVPTMLDLADAPVVPHRDEAPAEASNFVSGVSLVGDVQGTPAPQRDIVIDMPGGPYNEARRALIHDDLKLIVSRDAAKELYDLARDPAEAQDVWATRRREIEAVYAVTKSRLRLIEVKPR